jgi:hypothetical protein
LLDNIIHRFNHVPDISSQYYWDKTAMEDTHCIMLLAYRLSTETDFTKQWFIDTIIKPHYLKSSNKELREFAIKFIGTNFTPPTI